MGGRGRNPTPLVWIQLTWAEGFKAQVFQYFAAILFHVVTRTASD